MRLTLLGFVMFASLAWADAWTFFRPEFVLSYSCTVRDVQMQAHGVGEVHEVYQAEASAERSQEGKWSMTVGEFPHTLKGRHEAEKVCSKWMDSATQKVKAAQ